MQRRLSVDGFARRQAPPRAIQKPVDRSTTQVRSRQVPRQKPTPPPPLVEAKRRPFAWLQTSFVILFGLGAGMLAEYSAFGQAAIAIYGIVALVCKIASYTTFTLAFISMVTTVVLLVGRGDPGLAQNFATYTFLFLAIGVITLARELKKEGGRVYSIRQRQSDR